MDTATLPFAQRLVNAAINVVWLLLRLGICLWFAWEMAITPDLRWAIAILSGWLAWHAMFRTHK